MPATLRECTVRCIRPELQAALTTLRADNYQFPRSVFPTGAEDLLQINDISLPWGGLFDVNGNWAPPHGGHRWGNMADLRTKFLVGNPLHPAATVVGDPHATPAVNQLVRTAHLRMFDDMRWAAKAAGGNVLTEGNHLHVVY